MSGKHLDTDDRIALVRHEISQAQGFDSNIQAQSRKRALDLYFARPGNGTVPTGAEGRSSDVSTDVANIQHSLMAQIAPMLKASSIEFEAQNEADEKQAELESNVIEDVLRKNNAFDVINSGLFDGLLQANGWIKVFIDEQVEVSRETAKEILPETVAQITQPGQDEEIEVVGFEEQGERVTITLERTKTTRNLVVETVPPENMLHTANAGHWELQDIRFIGERKLLTVSELIDLGLTLEEALASPVISSHDWTAGSARQDEYLNQLVGSADSFQDAAMLREVWDCYMLIDIEGDGRLERRHMMVAGSSMVVDETYSHVPYVTGCMVPIPHRLQGLGVGDIFGDIQLQKTQTIRQFIDNLAVANRQRIWYVDGMVNEDDLHSGYHNGTVRCDEPGVIGELPASDIGPQCIQALSYFDATIVARGGGAVEYNDAETQLASSSIAGATGVANSKEQMSGWYSYNITNTLFKNVYLLVHQVLREGWPGVVDSQIAGKWVQSEPMKWPERKTAVSVEGLTPNQRQRKMQALTAVLQQQGAWMTGGGAGIITDSAKMYNAAADWIKASGLENPEQYLIDPDSDEARQVAEMQSQAAQAQAQQLAELQERQLKVEKIMADEKNSLEAWKHSTELTKDYHEIAIKAGTEEQTASVDAAIELQKLDKEKNETTARNGAGGA